MNVLCENKNHVHRISKTIQQEYGKKHQTIPHLSCKFEKRKCRGSVTLITTILIISCKILT